MNGITVTMAIVDFIPVVLFFAAAVLLQNDLYSKLSKTKYTLLSAGSLIFKGASSIDILPQAKKELGIPASKTQPTQFTQQQGE